MLIRKIPVYQFESLKFNNVCNADFLNESFYLQLPKLPESFEKEKTFFSVPNSLELRVIKRSYGDNTPDILSVERECCFYFNEENEWILEAVCHMETEDKVSNRTSIVRLPLSAPFMKNAEIGLYFDGTWIRFIKDGKLLNENTGFDKFCEPTGEIFIDEAFKDISVASVNNVSVIYTEEESEASADFYFPAGWNADVGDVMSFSHNGVYHLMYLLDRRHHGSGPCGEHYIAHLTTENLVDWYEQKPIAEITAPWMSYGTGTMTYHNGKYYMSYGLHTERYGNGKEKKVPNYNEEAGGFERLSFDNIIKGGSMPTGASYSVSDDGINFEPSKILIHSARNPSAYTNENGGVTLYCGYGGDGVFEADSFEKPFKRSDKSFNFAWGASLMRNTSECPALFSWNGYKYLIVGFTGYYRTLAPNSDEFADAAALGENVYDGLSVPMVAEFGDDRRILAGWVCNRHLGWGGVLMQRELIQEENGKLGMKWIPEFAPKVIGDNLIASKNILNDKIEIEEKQSYYLELNINPKAAEKIGISLSDGEKGCTLELNFKEKRMQINDSPADSFGEQIPTMLEAMQKADKDITDYKKTGFTDIPQNAVNYCLPDIQGINEPFKLKLMLRYSKKMNGTIVDAEIAGRRTLISVRNAYYPTALSVISLGECEVTNAKLNKLICIE